MTLRQMADAARKLANETFSSEHLRCSSAAESCLELEGNRPLTRNELKDGWARRPFWAYDTSRFCNSCLAYYFAERAAQVLHEKACSAAKAER